MKNNLFQITPFLGTKTLPVRFCKVLCIFTHMWSNLAATQGHKTARKTRDIIAKSMTTSQIAEAQHRAREKFAEIQAQREKKEEKQ